MPDLPSSPFLSYPNGGASRLGRPRDATNSRHGYGLELQRRTHASSCAYCGVSLIDDYYHWLLLQVDHVVPRSVGAMLTISTDLIDDFFNLVLACAGCNAAKNRY